MLQSLLQRRCKAGDYHNRHHHQQGHHHHHHHHHHQAILIIFIVIITYDSTDINVATKVFDFLICSRIIIPTSEILAESELSAPQILKSFVFQQQRHHIWLFHLFQLFKSAQPYTCVKKIHVRV